MKATWAAARFFIAFIPLPIKCELVLLCPCAIGIFFKADDALEFVIRVFETDSNFERVESFIQRFIQVLASGGAGGAELMVGGALLTGRSK